jgi:hypothetical protein
MTLTLQALKTAYPWIPWEEPVALTSGGQHGYACRICLARYGQKGYDPPPFHTYAHAKWHLRVAHGS